MTQTAEVTSLAPGPTASFAAPHHADRSLAGALYLVNVVAGAFAIGYVQTRVFGADPATTAANSRRTSCSTGRASPPTSW